MAIDSNIVPSVGHVDALKNAMDAAMARAADCGYKPGLIDQLSQSDWDAWDAANEIATVIDEDELGEEGERHFGQLPIAA
jgi:hypothetical protein